jgi:putative copper resistance protein D
VTLAWALILPQGLYLLSIMTLFGSALVALLCLHRVPTETRMPLPRGLVWGAAIAAVSSTAIYLLNFVGNLSLDASLIETIEAIFFETSFGQWWIARVVLLAGLTASVWVSDLAYPVLLFSGLLLISENGLGHAAADGLLSRSSIVVHVLAAATWLGGLTVLLATIRWRPQNRLSDDAERIQTIRILHRFSVIGVVAVALLISTGLYNIWMRLGNRPWRINIYDQALLLKLILVVVMLGFALLNRMIFLPRLESKPRSCQALRCSIAIEQIIGILVLIDTAALGQMAPVE